MGIHIFELNLTTTKHVWTLKEAKLREGQSPVPAVLDSNSQLVVSIVSSARETMLNVSELVPPSTWLPSWNTWPLRFLNWPVTMPVTTRRQDHPTSLAIGHP